jgi:transcriptional regulator with XRE-family HTH domain
MKDRILKFLTHEGITATKFADEIGVQRSSVSHILSGRNNPGFEFIQKILERYKTLNAEWLIMGIGSMIKKNDPPAPNPVSFNSGKTIQPSLFANKTQVNLSSGEDDILLPSSPPVKNMPSRSVEKILIFYSDKTFEEYLPSK